MSRTSATIEVVVVLPWLPATATPYLSRISSASISARGITGTPRRRASSTSGLSRRTAVEVTTTWAPPHVLGRVALGDARAERGEPVGHGRALQVGAGHRVAEVQQHLGDAAHARAADADEVHVLDLPKHARPPAGVPTQQVGHARGGVGPRRGRRAACFHARRSAAGVVDERRDGARRAPAPREVLLLDHARARPRPRSAARVRALVVVGGRAKGTSTAALPAAVSSAQVVAPLRDDHEVGRGEAPLHVVEEGHDLGLAPGRARRPRRPPRASRARSGGRCAGGRGPRQVRQRRRPGLVEDARALAAAEGEQRAAAAAWSLPRQRRRSRRARGCR